MTDTTRPADEREAFEAEWERWQISDGGRTTSTIVIGWHFWQARAASQPAQEPPIYSRSADGQTVFLHNWPTPEQRDAIASQPAQEPVTSLERWGMKSPDAWPFFEKVDDGYWTPWHIADAALRASSNPLTAQVQACRPEDRAMLQTDAGRELLSKVADAMTQPAQEPVSEIEWERAKAETWRRYATRVAKQRDALLLDTARADRIMELADEMADRFADKQSNRMHYPTALDAYLEARRALEAEVRKV
jgi:hypothetical protein